MTALIVIACILVVLCLIGLVRVGARVLYSERGLFVTVKAGPVKLQVLPAKAPGKKTEPKPKPAQTVETAQNKPKRDIKDTLSLVMRFLPLVGEAAGRFKRKIRMDRLVLHIIWGASDPAAAAKGYGAGHAAMGIIWPIIEHNFKVKDYDLRVDVDFQREKPEIEADAQATLTIGQGVSMAVCLGVKTLKIYLGYRREKKEQKAVQV